MRRLIVAAAAVLLALLLPAGAAHAARKVHGAPVTGPTLTASCAGVGQLLSVTGDGYAPDTLYNVYYLWPTGAEGGTAVQTDSNGTLTDSETYCYWLGDYTVESVDEPTQTVIASASFTVTG